MSEASGAQRSGLKPAIFLDRDGTINEDRGYISDPDEIILYPGTGEAIRLINQSGFLAIVVTNQSGVARGFCTEEQLGLVHARLREELERFGARLDAIYYCPHHPEIGDDRYRQDCECRKPRPAMLLSAARDYSIDLARSYVIGDKASDIDLAKAAGARAALVLTGYGDLTLSRVQGSGGGEQGEDERWRRSGPDIVADNLLDAVKQILDMEKRKG